MKTTNFSANPSALEKSIFQNFTIEDMNDKQKPDNIEVQINKVIGEGKNGTVYSVNLNEKLVQKELAMKVIRRYDKISLKVTQADLIELEILKDIENPYVNKIIDYYIQQNEQTQQKELVILQPKAIWNLEQYTQSMLAKSERMPENQAIEFLAQIAIGLKAIHDKNINHRNLSEKNVLLFSNENRTTLNDSEYIFKISDQGCTKIIENNMDEISQKNQFNYNYQTYSPFVDIFEYFATVFSVSIEAQEEKFADDLEKHYPQKLLEKRFLRSLQHNVPEIGRIFFKMRQIESRFYYNKRQFQYEKVIESQQMESFLKKQKGNLTNLKFTREPQKNGNIFVGFLKDDKKYYGRIYEQDTIKEGYFVYGILDGKGCQFDIHDKNENYYYDGEFVMGKYHGKGCMIMSRGIMYHGDFFNGQRQGAGKYYYENGNIYHGQFKNNKEDGSGILEFPNGGHEKGNWRHGYKYGIFERTYANGKQMMVKYNMGNEMSRVKKES
eukprot:403355389